MSAVSGGVDRITIEPIELPATVRDRCPLGRIDYSDAFRVGGAGSRSPRQWADAMLAGASLARRGGLLAGWTLIGIRLDRPWSLTSILGWPVLADDEEAVVLAAGSRLGIEGTLVFQRAEEGVVFATMVELRGPLAPRLWRLTEPLHVPIVRSLLVGAARRLQTKTV